jgi:hypothetical protein
MLRSLPYLMMIDRLLMALRFDLCDEFCFLSPLLMLRLPELPRMNENFLSLHVLKFWAQ